MKYRFPSISRAAAVLLLGLSVLPWLAAETASLLILHTNDIHDHVRAGDNGIGGIPYVSGYIKEVRSGRNDVLVLDAGDITEKGDLVAYRTHSDMTYEAVRRIGYDAVTIGNHEHDAASFGDLRHYESVLGQRLLCLNLTNPDGTSAFEASRIVEVNGIKVGLAGLIVPRAENGLDFAASGKALAVEAKRLRANGALLIVALCHETSEKCAEWSRAAPDVQVFVSGHSHEVLERPVTVAETGAIIVQAGSYARWVGRLELEVDRDTGRIVNQDGRLVAMNHSEVSVDAEMLAWVEAEEHRLAPEATEFVFNNPVELDGLSIARLAADGLRHDAGTDIGFCHAYQVIRDTLEAGPIDVNAIFRSGGQRGAECVKLELSGAEVDAYVNALYRIQKEPPEWSGFRVHRVTSAGVDTWKSDLEPARRYSVVMPKIELETRFLRVARKLKDRDPSNPLTLRDFPAEPVAVNFTNSLRGCIKRVLAEGDTLQARAERIAAERVY